MNQFKYFDKEYLPSIERAKLERRKTMPDPKNERNTEHLEEGVGMKDEVDEKGLRGVRSELEGDLDTLMEGKDKLDDDMVKPDLDAIEKRIDEMADKGLSDDCDQEPPMTTDRKIHMLAKIFGFAIGDRVKNVLDEEGIVDLVGLDRRGVLYLVQYKENNVRWEAEDCIKKNLSYVSYKDDDIVAQDPNIKTDIPEREYTGKHRIG